MNRVQGLAAGAVEDGRSARIRRRSRLERIAIEVRWSVAEAGVPGAAGTGTLGTGDRELIARIELEPSGSTAVLGTVEFGWDVGEEYGCTTRASEPPAARRPMDVRSVTGPVSERPGGWWCVRLADEDGLRIAFVLRRSARHGRGSGRVPTARLAYLTTNLLARLGVAGGRYSAPATRSTAVEKR